MTKREREELKNIAGDMYVLAHRLRKISRPTAADILDSLAKRVMIGTPERKKLEEPCES